MTGGRTAQKLDSGGIRFGRLFEALTAKCFGRKRKANDMSDKSVRKKF